MFIDYVIAKECKNNDERYSEICYKCGQCGRVFDENGVMVNTGETTPYDLPLPFEEEDYGEIH